MKNVVASAFALFTAAQASGEGQDPLPGVTFADAPGVLFAPVRSVGEAIGATVGYESGRVTLNGVEVTDTKSLPDGTRVVPVRSFTIAGATVEWDADTNAAHVTTANAAVRVERGEKRVVIDKSRQELRATQGGLVVLQTFVSTGRTGHRTPNGTFAAGPYKSRMHYSSLYNDAPMPYSVQIMGDIFVHGYASVPEVPASHGCIRLPLDGTARFFYEWVEVGTPVTIEGRWQS